MSNINFTLQNLFFPKIIIEISSEIYYFLIQREKRRINVCIMEKKEVKKMGFLIFKNFYLLSYIHISGYI